MGVFITFIVAACGQGGAGGATSKAAPQPSEGPVAINRIDSLLLSDAELQAMGIVYERAPVETTVPDWGGIDQSDPCQQVEWVSALQPFVAFRYEDSRGSSNFGIHQTLAVYSSEQAARTVFDKYSKYAASCTANGSLEKFTATTPTELAWSLPTKNEVGANAGNIAAWNIRVAQNVIVDIRSLRRRDGVTVTSEIANQIVAKINSSA